MNKSSKYMICNIIKWLYNHRTTLNYSTDLSMLNGQQLLKELTCLRDIVLVADKTARRLLLYAEMKLPGEAWLEFKIENNSLIQTATFRPLGLKGRLYWYSVMPLHELVFRGMINRITA